MVIVIGGANIDLKVRTFTSPVLGTSNPGLVTNTPGGVARNIAEHLAHLKVPVHFISAVGQDHFGRYLLETTQAAGVNIDLVLHTKEATGSYTATLDEQGELLIAVAAMQVMNRLTPAILEERQTELEKASWIIADGNLPEETLIHLLKCTPKHIRVIFEPVSVPKATRLLPALSLGLAPYMITPNLAELSALVGTDLPNDSKAVLEASQQLHAKGIAVVWTRRGEQGSVLSTALKTTLKTDTETHLLSALPTKVVDVTGAGDSMLAAFVTAQLHGLSLLQSAQCGHAAAAFTLESESSVPNNLTWEAVQMRCANGYSLRSC